MGTASQMPGIWDLLTERSGDLNLHGDLGRGVDSAVGVGLETRVHATRKGIARGGETRLGDGVVGVPEGEDDGVTDGSLDRGGAVGKASRTNVDAVGCAGGSNSAGRTRVDSRAGRSSSRRGRALGRRRSSGSRRRSSRGAGLIDDGGSSTGTTVHPQEDDLLEESDLRLLGANDLAEQESLAGIEGHLVDRDAVASNAVLVLAVLSGNEVGVPASGVDIVHRLGEGNGGKAQRDGCRELHICFLNMEITSGDSVIVLSFSKPPFLLFCECRRTKSMIFYRQE